MSYDATSITVLEGLEAVRKRPGMYIGSTGERGLHHLVTEVVDNSVDEALAGYCTEIEVTLLADGGVRVVDDGRGIPVDEHPVEKRPALEVIMTTLHAGGKFGGDGYAVSGGLHGVGVSVVNALSKRVEVVVYRDGKIWRQEYARGDATGPVTVVGDSDRTGTTTTFWADAEVFETTTYVFEVLARRLQETAFLNKGLRIGIRDERPGAENVEEGDGSAESHEPREAAYYYEDGIVDFVHYINATKDPVHSSVISWMSEDTSRGISLEMAMQWNTSFTESVYTFANTINTIEGGTHEEGFRAALTSLVNRYARQWGLLKDKDPNLTGDDVREGLTAIVSVKMREPQFEGQTKTKLGNTEAKTFVQTSTGEMLGAWFDANPSEGKNIARKAFAAATARVAARKARDLARNRKGLMGAGGLPGKLADCQSTIPEECEVFIVEGDSAGGSGKGGREVRTQAILPIRGKILNVEKARIDKVLQNQEVQAIISALGTGIHEDFDIAKLRYHKIILMADADVDGQHISTLLLTLLFRFMRPLIEGGYVYLAQPPLYRIKWVNQPDEFAYTEREREGLIRIGQENGKRVRGKIQRYKGLGEMNANELWETTMDPEHRVLRQVSLDDAAQADEMFSVLMGEDVESRRKFIQRNAKDVRFLDI